jgi:hypothetical protein
MRKEDGTFAKTEAENDKVLFDHFYKVVDRKELSAFDPTVIQEIDPRQTNKALNEPPNSTQIRAALQKMQYEKDQARTRYRQKPSRTSREAPYWRSRNSSLCSGKTASSCQGCHRSLMPSLDLVHFYIV